MISIEETFEFNLRLLQRAIRAEKRVKELESELSKQRDKNAGTNNKKTDAGRK